MYILLILLAIVYVAPLFWMILVSLKTNGELFSNPFGLTLNPQWENYYIAWTAGKLGIAAFNSALVCFISLALSMLFGAMAAFAIARMKWKFSGSALIFFLVGMMIPVHCILIPLFITFTKIGLTDTLTGLILPYISFSLPTTIFVLMGFFTGMPKELLEAACIDGSTIYGFFFKIALPLSKSGLFVTGLMTFVANWNELLVAMVFNSTDEKRTLPVTLTAFVSPYSTNYVQMFAAIVIAVLPTIVVYCMFSNKIVAGLTAGAVKG
jgi:raffinose/stachyose/melibiose transport system permease protein